jgi:hypothetical protein
MKHAKQTPFMLNCQGASRLQLTKSELRSVKIRSPPAGDTVGPLKNFWAILSLPDNVPIIFMLALVAWFTWLSFSQARKNDRLAREGRRDEILKSMQD